MSRRVQNIPKRKGHESGQKRAERREAREAQIVAAVARAQVAPLT